MARDSITKLYTRILNSFSSPVAGTPISPTDAEDFWDDIETAFNTVGSVQTGTGAIVSATDFGYPYNRILVSPDGVDVTGLGAGAQVATGLLIEMYPNSGAKGLRNGITAVVWVPGGSTVNTASPTGYCGGLFFGKTDIALGGTNTGAGAKGAIFGANSFATSGASATNLEGVVGHEVDVLAHAGSTMKIRLGYSSVDFGSGAGTQGASYDAAFSVGAAATSVKWKTGVLISDVNGIAPIDATTGKLFATQGSATVNYGVDISSYTITTSAFKSTGFTVSGTGATVITSAAVGALAVGASANPALVVDASAVSQATGITITGGAAGGSVGVAARSSGTNEALLLDSKGSGNLIFNNSATGQVLFGQRAAPVSSDGAALGSGSLMWSDLFLASGAVVNFNNSNFTITHTAGVLTFSGVVSAAFALPIHPQGRLTLTSATPVLTATVSAATTIYYTPYIGAAVPIYDGTNIYLKICAELSNITSNSATGSAGPAAVANNSVYDLFVWDNAGTATLTRGPLWTNDTTRSAGTALVRQNGIWLNNASITNGPAASRGTYVGTVRSNGSASIDWTLGASASGGTAGFLGVWNAYNRVTVVTSVVDSGTGYTYTSATVRQARASSGMQISFVSGLAEEGLVANFASRINTAAALASFAATGIGLDTTVGYNGQRGTYITPAAAALGGTLASTVIIVPQLGVHFISANENSDGTNASSFDVDQTATLSVTLRM